MKPLTEKQQKMLDFLKERIRTGVPPTVREICKAADIKSTSTAHAYLQKLEDAGYISREGGLTRSIRMPSEAVSRVPLVGKVTAGLPILAVEEVEDYVPYSGGGYPAEELFALRVSGTSMLYAGILDRDIVIVHKTPAAENGDIVVALVGDEATVKRLRRRDGQVWLMPENDAYSPIDGSEAELVGLVKALIREY